MEKPSFKLVGAPCGHHGQYTFYKAIRLIGERERIFAIGDFFFVKIWQDSELVSVGELQLLWTDRVSDQTLVSLRLYFLPENTPDGRGLHGQDEVLAINDKVVLRAEDLLSWVWSGEGWRWGLRAVWRGACAPPPEAPATAPLHHTRLDFSDVDQEKSAIVDDESPGVVVFSYPRYCRYRALLSRLEGIQGDWLRDSLVAALGGYAAPTKNTRILYCKDTFEYPELEGHEFVCNHLAPKLKGRPRGRRRRVARAGSPSPTPTPSPDRDEATDETNTPSTPRRPSLRNEAEKASDEEEEEKLCETSEDRAFMAQLKQFYRERDEIKPWHTLDGLSIPVSLRALYLWVSVRGGYMAVCRRQLWRQHSTRGPRVRRHYEKFLLPFENHARRNGSRVRRNRLDDPRTVATIDVTGSPQPERDPRDRRDSRDGVKRLRTPSPEIIETELKEELDLISKPAEELNREFLDSLPKEEKPLKISIKPVEKLVEPSHVKKLFEDNSALVSELVGKHSLKDSSKVIAEIGGKQLSDGSNRLLNELAHKLNLGNPDSTFLKEAQRAQHELAASSSLSSLSSLSGLGDKYVNGHDAPAPQEQQKSGRPAGRSSLRAVRVKPTRAAATPANTPPISSSVTESSTSPPAGPPPLNNFGIHHPPPAPTGNSHSDDEIVEVPYRPKTPEIIDLDEYPESPQSVKKKKLDILKERGLEVTAIPTWPLQPPLAPLMTPNPMLLNPAMQHQIMTQAQLFQMYNILPPNYNGGVQPPKVIQATSLFGTSGPEKTVYGNPKDPFMPPPHILHGTPVKPQRNIPSTTTPPHDILDLTCRTDVVSPSKPAVEIVRIPSSSPANSPQNFTKNYTLIDGKAVVGSNLEITLVNPRSQTPNKNRNSQKRSSNGKFMSSKTPTPPKEHPKQFPSPSGIKKHPIVVPNYQVNPRDDASPTSSTGSRDSQSNQSLANFKPTSLAQIMEMQKSVPSVAPFMDPVYMSALYGTLGNMDQRQLSVYRDLMASQFRYSGLLNMGVSNTPTTKN